MKKAIAVLLVVLLISFLTVAFAGFIYYDNETNRFLILESNPAYSIVMDNDTGVVYVLGSRGTLDPIYNQDGTLYCMGVG